MKKIISFLVAFVMLLSMAGCLAGCNSGGTVSDERTIKVLYSGWVNGSVPTDYTNNPYKKVIDET